MGHARQPPGRAARHHAGGERSSTPSQALIMLGIAFTCGLIGGSIGKRKGREWAGILLGIFLSVIGIVIIASMPLPMRHGSRTRRSSSRSRPRLRGGRLPVASAAPGRTTGVAGAVALVKLASLGQRGAHADMGRDQVVAACRRTRHSA